jgi:transposase
MPRKAKVITCDEETRKRLERMANGRKTESRLVHRARIVLGCLDGKRIMDLADELGERKDIIIKWRDRFVEMGIEGLRDAPRSGKPATYGGEWQTRVLAKLDEEPPNGQARWDGPSLARALGTSEDAVQRFLQREGIQLSRMRTWCVSTDPEFAAKAADIVGLYLAPPENAVVISVDEKPGIQALSRTTGVIRTSDNRIVSVIKSTYRRNGTRNLFAALEVATGQLHGKTTGTKKRVDFLEFMDDLLRELPQEDGIEYHVILDNYCIHKRCDEWLGQHRNVHFHYTPTSASWLNMVEIWFNIMTRKVLRGASFDDADDLAKAIARFIDAYNETARPFIWKKREVKGSQIADKLSNICV